MPDCNERLVGSSPAVLNVNEQIDDAARSDAKVLIAGESGAGKEVVASLIHRRSERSHRAFVTINCAGVPDSLLESELFGHVRGSFTDAYRDRPGLLERADGGTLFLDEVGEMSPRMQGMLLRFLETGEIQRVGEHRPPQRVNVRVVAATNRVLLERVSEGAFRQDLYYRLNVIHIVMPPLRERRADIPLLLETFLHSFGERYGVPTSTLTPEALQRLVEYRWPGNVRELKNVVERLMIRRHPVIGVEQLPAALVAPAPATAPRAAGTGNRNGVIDALMHRMLVEGESFWPVVYDTFMVHDLTRDDVRAVVSQGLEKTRGNHAALVQLFNMTPGDTNAFQNFLKKHRCQIAATSLKVHAVRPPEAPRSRVTRHA
jgi:transcriptional regulator with PAS, ATPase and Fis domain